MRMVVTMVKCELQNNEKHIKDNDSSSHEYAHSWISLTSAPTANRYENDNQSETKIKMSEDEYDTMESAGMVTFKINIARDDVELCQTWWWWWFITMWRDVMKFYHSVMMMKFITLFAFRIYMKSTQHEMETTIKYSSHWNFFLTIFRSMMKFVEIEMLCLFSIYLCSGVLARLWLCKGRKWKVGKLVFSIFLN